MKVSTGRADAADGRLAVVRHPILVASDALAWLRHKNHDGRIAHWLFPSGHSSVLASVAVHPGWLMHHDHGAVIAGSLARPATEQLIVYDPHIKQPS